ncbi:GNAT family N-acetyltransferase [Bacillus sp. EAC]|uniref:GNAT family N-acetyltransferase n=1 Tax=Bacillus sp. EAC TaxID=1978338 RepID=UPI000B42E7D4|nr:GNAT family N-acetyltransferase [Bacillus sp. EAC]
MKIYQATNSDLNGITSLFNEYRMFYKQEENLEGARDFIYERFQQSDSVIFTVVEDGEYLGFTQLYPSFSSVSMKRLWILNDLFVVESARKKGVAQMLLDAAKNFAIETNAKSIELQTAFDNKQAQRLYEKNSYKVETTFYTYSLSLENKK